MYLPLEIKEYLDKNPNTGRAMIADKFEIPESLARVFCRVHKGSRKASATKGIVKRGIAIGDLHFPYHDPACLKILMEFVKDFDPDYFLKMGDMFDFDTISFFNKSKPKLTEGKRFKKDFEQYKVQVMAPIEEALRPECKKVFVIGNHEYRIDRLIEGDPQWEGFAELENNIDLSDWEVVPFNHSYKIGEMYFIHGIYWNMHHAKKNVMTYGENVFNWHVHTNQVYTLNSPLTQQPKQGVSIGCMGNLNPQWMLDKPNSWVHQFMFFYLYDDGTYTYYTPIIIDGKCTINGKLYGG